MITKSELTITGAYPNKGTFKKEEKVFSILVLC